MPVQHTRTVTRAYKVLSPWAKEQNWICVYTHPGRVKPLDT